MKPEMREQLLRRLRLLKTEVDAIETLVRKVEPFDFEATIEPKGQRGPTAAILDLLAKKDSLGGLTAGEIAEKLRESVKTEAKNERQVIQSTLVNLNRQKRIVFEDQKYRLRDADHPWARPTEAHMHH